MVVFLVRTDPAPWNAVFDGIADCTVMRPDANRPKPADALEMKGRVPRILAKDPEACACELLDFGR